MHKNKQLITCTSLPNFLFCFEILAMALPAYSETRTVDAHAICDLAMYNYVEVY